MTNYEKIAILVDALASKYSLRIERWKDESKHWRVGINWYSEEDFEYVCEKPTLLEALEDVVSYLENV